MGKLNYINRKSEGVKLGAIVRKDLGKRKSSKSSHKDTSPIDLHLEGKALSDQGLEEVALGLVDTLTTDGQWTDKVVALNLAKNGLTACALGHLAPAIRLSILDLQDLDLSDNEISLITDEDILHWESFLSAFRHGRHMRKLDLSGNNLARPRAWEVLARITHQHFNDSKQLWNLTSGVVDDDRSETSLTDNCSHLAISEKPDTRLVSSKSHTSDVLVPSKASGLPAIRHINLEQTGIPDTGCLFLTYVIERHRYVANEIEGLLWMRKSDDRTDVACISYTTEGAGPVGAAILKDAEVVPFDPCLSDEYDFAPDEYAVSPSSARKSSIPEHVTRRTSDNSSHHDSDPLLRASRTLASHRNLFSNAETSLDRGRKKLQRTTIEEWKLPEIELWNSAIRLLLLVREFLVTDDSFAKRTFEGWSHDQPPTAETPLTQHSTPDKRMTEVGLTSENDRPEFGRLQDSYSSKLTVDTSRTSADTHDIDKTTHKPLTPQVIRRRGLSNNAEAFSPQSSISESNFSSPEGVRPRGPLSLARLKRPPEMVGKLPIDAWVKVLCHLADPNGILSERQVQLVVKHGRSKSSLSDERVLLGKTQAVQIWWALQMMGCLSYGDDTPARPL